MLGRSELNLTTLSLLAPLLTADTLSLLHEARFKTKPQVLALIANHAAKPDAPDSIRRLPRPSVREASAHWFAPGEGSSLINRFDRAHVRLSRPRVHGFGAPRLRLARSVDCPFQLEILAVPQRFVGTLHVKRFVGMPSRSA